MNLLALALIQALALGAEPATRKSVAVLVIPMNGAAETSSVKLESFLSEALALHPALKVKQSDQLFGLPNPAGAEAALKSADALVVAAQSSKGLEREKKLRAALAQYETAAPAMKACGKLCDALAMFAAAFQARGDLEETKSALLDLIALKPDDELDLRRLGPELSKLKTQVATGKLGALRGALVVSSTPPGARVVVDQQLLGYTPVTLPSLPIGKHLVRVERPGYTRCGELVDLTPEGATVSAELAITPGYKRYDATLDKLAEDASKGRVGPTLTSLGTAVGVEQALIALVKQAEGTTELNLALFDLKSGRKLAGKLSRFQGDEYGQLKAEVAKVINGLMAGDASEKPKPGSDPLENRAGIDEWNAEKVPAPEAKKKKAKPSGDPLESHSGTEDW